MDFTQQEVDYIISNYPNIKTKDIAAELGRPIGSIYNKAFALKLKKTEAFLKSDMSGVFIKGSQVGKEHRFVKGQTPHNKGKKMSPGVYKRCSATMFKKGDIPPNTKYFGKPHLVIRKKKNGYQEKVWLIRKDNKIYSYLGYLCSQHGIDLKGKVARLRPGFDINNVPTINDLVIVTRADNMRLNSLLNYPEDLAQLIRIKGVLNRHIKKLA